MSFGHVKHGGTVSYETLSFSFSDNSAISNHYYERTPSIAVQITDATELCTIGQSVCLLCCEGLHTDTIYKYFDCFRLPLVYLIGTNRIHYIVLDLFPNPNDSILKWKRLLGNGGIICMGRLRIKCSQVPAPNSRIYN